MGWFRRRGSVATGSISVGDLAEALVAKRLGLRLAAKSTPGYDAVADDGTRYQIKARRLGSPGDRELSGIRNIDQRLFDYLVVVLFDNEMRVVGMWRLPFDFVRENATYKRHVNAHILYARDSILRDSRAERLQ